MWSQILTVDYNNLCTILDQQNTVDPERTKWNLDIMRDNFSNNIAEILQWNTAIIEIDHDKNVITLLGEALKGHYYGIPTYWENQSEDIIFYNHINAAIEQSKKSGNYDEIFKEIQPKK